MSVCASSVAWQWLLGEWCWGPQACSRWAPVCTGTGCPFLAVTKRNWLPEVPVMWNYLNHIPLSWSVQLHCCSVPSALVRAVWSNLLPGMFSLRPPQTICEDAWCIWYVATNWKLIPCLLKTKPRLYNILHVKDRNSVTEVCSSAWVTNKMQAGWTLAFHFHEGSGGANSWNSAATPWLGSEKAP